MFNWKKKIRTAVTFAKTNYDLDKTSIPSSFLTFSSKKRSSVGDKTCCKQVFRKGKNLNIVASKTPQKKWNKVQTNKQPRASKPTVKQQILQAAIYRKPSVFLVRNHSFSYTCACYRSKYKMPFAKSKFWNFVLLRKPKVLRLCAVYESRKLGK